MRVISQQVSMKVFFVGANEPCRTTLVAASAAQGWQYAECSSAVEAIRRCVDIKPDVLVLEMPLVDALWSDFVYSVEVFLPHCVCIVLIPEEVSSDDGSVELGPWASEHGFRLDEVSDRVVNVLPLSQAAEQLLDAILEARTEIGEQEEPVHADSFSSAYDLYPEAVASRAEETSDSSLLTYDELLAKNEELEKHQGELLDQVLLAGNLATVGVQLADIAQQLNDHLNDILGFAELLKDGQMTGSFVDDAVNVIYTKAQEASSAVRMVVSVAGMPRAHAFDYVDFECLLNEVVAWRSHTRELERITIEVECTPSPLYVQCDDRQVRLLLTNVLMNAEQSVVAKRNQLAQGMSGDEGYKCRLDAEEYVGHITIRASLTDDKKILVCVADNGIGCDEELVGTAEEPGRIFEPFYTSFPRSEHMGLGLAICSSVVHSHGGSIYANTRLGEGFELYLKLPTENSKAFVAERIHDDEGDSMAAARTILVLEDDPLGARLAYQHLLRYGYKVKVARGGAEGLEILQSEKIDAVVSDYRMPVIDGRKFYELAMQIRPELADRVVFITGFVLNSDTREFLRKCGCTYLMKPFAGWELLKAVNGCFPS